MKRLVPVIVLLTFIFVGARSAQASTVTFNALLTPPCAACAAPGFYNGTGNPDGGFTLVNDNNIEVALRAKYRQNPAVITSTGNVYDVVTGDQTNVTSGGNGANTFRFAWNWEFDINLRPNGLGTLTLDDIDQNTFLLIENLTGGGSVLINPFSQFADDATWGTAGERLPSNTAAGIAGGDWGAQNSQNCAFAGSCPASFTMASNDLLRLTLTVGSGTPLAGSLLATNTIYVRAGTAPFPAPIPEPATLSLLGLGFAGLAAKMRSRRRR